MIDIHCHILNNLDDGSGSLEESVAMAKIARESGTDIIVATPHTNVSRSSPNYISKEITDRVLLLQKALEEKNIKVKILLGQEIFCNDRTADLFAEGKLITLNNSKYPLIEFDFLEYSDSVYNKLEKIIAQGYKPIVAHPERYKFTREDDKAIYKLKNMGCLLQVNKGSIVGAFGRNAEYVAHRLLDKRLADFVASDAHSPYMRTPYMANVHELICEDYSSDYADFLFEDNPKAVLENKKVYSF